MCSDIATEVHHTEMFKVFTLITVKMSVFWDVILFNLVHINISEESAASVFRV
jgi:hypothetical protein